MKQTAEQLFALTLDECAESIGAVGNKLTVLVQGQHAMPVTAGLYSLNGQWIAAWHLVSAGSIVAALPPVAMFFLMQRHFIAGLTLGATKG